MGPRHGTGSASVRGLHVAEEAVDFIRYRVGVAAEQAFAAWQFDELGAGDVVGQVKVLSLTPSDVRREERRGRVFAF
jgi:hypothetical protein